jgi:hypothetical protein
MDAAFTVPIRSAPCLLLIATVIGMTTVRHKSVSEDDPARVGNRGLISSLILVVHSWAREG